MAVDERAAAPALPDTARRLAPLDRWTLAYAAIVTLALLVRWPQQLTHPWLLLVGHAMLAAAALAAPRARSAGGIVGFVGEFYPLLLLWLLYGELGLINTAAGVSHDALVQRWEQALFGAQPARDWIRAWPWPWLSWILHIAYLSYYAILASAPLGLWFSGRSHAARETALLMMVTFYLCYTVFLAFPVAGPRYLFPLADNAATAVAPAAFTQRLLNQGAAWGTAFPSSHVAAALVASLSAWCGWRLLGSVLTLAAVLLALGTVYGQFHYAIDALAGALLAALVLTLRPRLTSGL